MLDFSTETDQEINEAVAIALGWTRCKLEGLELYWYDRRGPTLGFDLPNWVGNNGMAFAALWPEITKLVPRGVWVGQAGGSPEVYGWAGLELQGSTRWRADTYSRAICHAFLFLKGVAK